ncbi:MAG: phosphate/phosphite/phosphonate ABC transporter substrate-binding protein [Pseudomonadota bacterium]
MKRIVAFLLASCLAASAHAATPTPLRVGVLPTLSAKVLLTNYQPMRTYLERELQRPVELLTAPDFKRFHQDTLAGDFDVLVTAPHLARLAQTEAGFQPIATYLSANRAILITSRSKPVKHVNELRGSSLAIFDPLAFIVLDAQQWLEDQGLVSGRDYRSQVFPSHNSVGQSVQQGDSPLGVISPAGLRQLAPEIAAQVQTFKELPQAPALIWIAHPRAGASDRIQAALLRFADTPEGERFYAGNAYKGMRPVTPEEMRALDRSAREVKRLLQGRP